MAVADRRKLEALTDGVFAWMADHPISVHDALSEGVKEGVKQWLNAHADEVVEAIAERLARRLKSPERNERNP